MTLAIVMEACRRLGLKPREATLLRDACYSHTLVENGHFLITPGRVPAARRLIARGYLEETAEQPVPFDPVNFGLVIVMEQDHLNKLIADANDVVVVWRAARADYPPMLEAA